MRKYLFSIALLFLLGACSSPPDDPDWCYTFDFTQSDYGFNIASGVWIDGTGLFTLVVEEEHDTNEDGITDFTSSYGELSASFLYPYSIILSPTVEMTHATVNIHRAPSVETDEEIDILAIGEIFGIGIDTRDYALITGGGVYMPYGMDQANVTAQRDTDEEATNQINITLQATQRNVANNQIASAIYISELTIYGEGENPFPEDSCGEPPDITNTPTNIPTFTPTYTPTNTPTPSITPTPSNTPEPQDWCVFLDFREQVYNGADGIDINVSPPGWGGGWVDGLGYKSVLSGSQQFNSMKLEFSSAITVTSIEYHVDITGAFDANQYSAVFYTEFWTGSVYDRVDSFSGSGITEDFTRLTYTGSYYNQTFRIAGNPYVTNPWYFSWLELRGSGSFPFPNLENDCNNETPTPTPEVSSTPSNTPDGTTTPSTPDGTVTGTDTPNPSSTYIPSGTPYATQEAGEGTPTPSVPEIRENEAEWQILDELQRHDNAVENELGGIGDSLDGINDSLDDLVESDQQQQDILSQIGDTISDVTEGISSGLESAAGIGGKISNFLGEGVGTISRLFTAFYAAPPSPITGLPQCMSAPLDHDICAIYYILDWTLFAPNTPGQYIIPLLQSIIRIFIIFRAIRILLKIIKRGEDVTRV